MQNISFHLFVSEGGLFEHDHVVAIEVVLMLVEYVGQFGE